jgi:hypothetical protein
MAADGIPPEGAWPVPQLVDRRQLEHARSDDAFRQAAVGLATEFGELAALLAGVRADGDGGPEAAVRRGLVVRAVKYTRALIAETFAGHGELQALFDRLLFETVVDLAYLLRGRSERARAFIAHAVGPDRELWAHLAHNRELRRGEELPMEQRARRRLEAYFAPAGLTPGEPASGGAAERWPPLAERLAAIGEPSARAMHSLGAGSTHGAWHELVTFQLAAGDRFEAQLAWSRPLIQPLFALPIQGGRVLAAYARSLGADVETAFRGRLLDLVRRAAEADLQHEEFMARADALPPPEG